MKKTILYMLMALFLFCAVLVACTSKKEGGTEMGAIDKMTGRAAKGMADSIQIPLQQARVAAKQQEDKMRELDEALKDN
jgi:predicted nucleotide-binding protein (sugar kinase/HSP70/actin superfamily)